jgi:hypothetical protein
MFLLYFIHKILIYWLDNCKLDTARLWINHKTFSCLLPNSENANTWFPIRKCRNVASRSMKHLTLQPLLVPCRPDTPTYKPQVKISCRTCIHTLPRVLWLRISPPSWGGLRRCHVPYGSGPRLPAEVDSSAATCPMALDLASRLRWAPVLPRALWL